MQIGENTYVAIDYTLTLNSGEEVDSSKEGAPLSFITGFGQVIPGLEKEVLGLRKGDSVRITVLPEDAYGPVRDDLYQDIPRSQFPEQEEIKPGMAFEAQGPRGPFMIVVKSLNDDDTVTVDLNHPLAGEQLNFDLKIVDVRQPSDAELAALKNGGCGCGCGPDTADCGSSGCSC